MEITLARHVRRTTTTAPTGQKQTRESKTESTRQEPTTKITLRRGKSDLILEGVLRVERYLQELNANLTSSATAPALFRGAHQSLISPILASSNTTRQDSFSCSPLAEVHPTLHHPQQHEQQQQQQQQHRQQTPVSAATPVANNLENAVLDSMHTSTTESVLQWPHFDGFPSLRHDYAPIFHLEQSRPAFRTRPMSMCPYAPAGEVDSVLDAFEHGVNFWYPTVSRAQVRSVRLVMVDSGGGSGEGEGGETQRCLALLTMALGCASQVIGGLAEGVAMGEGEWERRRARREVGDRYFDCVMRMLHVAHTDVSPAAAHCLLFVA